MFNALFAILYHQLLPQLCSPRISSRESPGVLSVEKSRERVPLGIWKHSLRGL